jgi:hypothetical protein
MSKIITDIINYLSSNKKVRKNLLCRLHNSTKPYKFLHRQIPYKEKIISNLSVICFDFFLKSFYCHDIYWHLQFMFAERKKNL